ncbi:extracellular ribonuclease le [Quercus suber]|uniref:Extracellular ribonuclease le n=1 Tax=Quercus suber TaxID=58331 RepID=A0AAW0KL57_QUESU
MGELGRANTTGSMFRLVDFHLGKSITFKRKAKENDVTEVVLAFNEDILPHSKSLMMWPRSYCDTKQSCCYPTRRKPKTNFSIHGLWPNYNDGSSLYIILKNSDLISRMQACSWVECNVDASRNNRLYLRVDTFGSQLIKCPVIPKGGCASNIDFPTF